MNENHAPPVVLIVDDDRSLRRLLQVTLERQKYELYEAYDGAEAIRMATEHKPDIILLDIMMPSIDGIEVCKRIKSDPALSGTYIILLTALGQERDRKEGMEARADAYMIKPFSPIQLISAIEEYLSKKLGRKSSDIDTGNSKLLKGNLNA
ncbi:MAG: response regulator [Sideroxydans sp.]|jgi:DNA-binding response OmpR family regulator